MMLAAMMIMICNDKIAMVHEAGLWAVVLILSEFINNWANEESQG